MAKKHLSSLLFLRNLVRKTGNIVHRHLAEFGGQKIRMIRENYFRVEFVIKMSYRNELTQRLSRHRNPVKDGFSVCMQLYGI